MLIKKLLSLWTHILIIDMIIHYAVIAKDRRESRGLLYILIEPKRFFISFSFAFQILFTCWDCDIQRFFKIKSQTFRFVFPSFSLPFRRSNEKEYFLHFYYFKIKNFFTKKKKKLIHSLNSPSKIKNKKKFLAFLTKLFIFTKLYISSLLLWKNFCVYFFFDHYSWLQLLRMTSEEIFSNF